MIDSYWTQDRSEIIILIECFNLFTDSNFSHKEDKIVVAKK